MDIEQHVTESATSTRFRVEGCLSCRLWQLNGFFQGNLAQLVASQKRDAQLRDYHIRPNIRISRGRVFRHDESKLSK